MITLHIKCDTDKEIEFAQDVSQDLLVVFEDAKILITHNEPQQTEMELN